MKQKRNGKCIILLLPSGSYRAEAFMSAAEGLPLEVITGVDHEPTLASLTPEKYLVLDFGNPEASALAIVDFSRTRTPPDAIIGVDEESQKVAALAGMLLKLPHNTLDSVLTARNKFEFRQKLYGHSFPNPSFTLFHTENNPQKIFTLTQYPCVLKPTILSASRAVYRANDRVEFISAFQQIKDFMTEPSMQKKYGREAEQILVEDYIPGTEVALEGILGKGEVTVLTIFDKPDPLEGPDFYETIYTTPTQLSEEIQIELKKVTESVCRCIGLTEGPIHAEFRLNEEGIWPLEIASRSIGGLCSRMLKFQFDISLEEVILRHALGEKVEKFSLSRKASGVMMLYVPQKGKLQQIRGIEEAEELPCIDEIRITIPLGQLVEPPPRGIPYLGFIFASASTPGEVENSLRKAFALLEIIIEES